MSSLDLQRFLCSVPIFADVDRRALELLAQVSVVKRVPKGQFLFFQDDPGEAAYIVVKGTIGIVLTTPDGRELVINEMHSGDCFGELALLQGEPRSAGAVAREDSTIVWIPCREFLAEVEAEPRLMRQLLETMADRLRNSGERESALAFLNANARLARFLLQRSEEEELLDLVTISQEEIAAFIGVTRQTVAKILGEWRRDGWIITGRGKIMLVDRKALLQLAEEDNR
jgi:CRP-like cAMP-binding protein